MNDMNKYEMILIAAREARRLNDVSRILGRELKVRPTSLAWDRLAKGEVQFTYEPERFEVPEESEVEESV